MSNIYSHFVTGDYATTTTATNGAFKYWKFNFSSGTASGDLVRIQSGSVFPLINSSTSIITMDVGIEYLLNFDITIDSFADLGTGPFDVEIGLIDDATNQFIAGTPKGSFTSTDGVVSNYVAPPAIAFEPLVKTECFWGMKRVDGGNAFTGGVSFAAPTAKILSRVSLSTQNTIAGPTSIGDIDDVDLTTNAPTDGQSLTWNDATGTFVPTDPASGGASVAGNTTEIQFNKAGVLSATERFAIVDGTNDTELKISGSTAEINFYKNDLTTQIFGIKNTSSATTLEAFDGNRITVKADSGMLLQAKNELTLFSENAVGIRMFATDPAGQIRMNGIAYPKTQGTAGQLMAVSADTSVLEFVDAPSGGATTLDSLTDVVTTTPSIGDVLVWAGTAWVAQSRVFQQEFLIADFVPSAGKNVLSIPAAVHQLPYTAGDIFDVSLVKDDGTNYEIVYCEIKVTGTNGDITLITATDAFDGRVKIRV